MPSCATSAATGVRRADAGRVPASAAGVPEPAPEQAAAPSGPMLYALAQILVRVPEGSSPEQLTALRKKAEGLLARAKRR